MGFYSTFFKIIFLVGGVFMLIVSIMAFVNVEALRINRGKHNKSGIMLLITSIVSINENLL